MVLNIKREMNLMTKNEDEVEKRIDKFDRKIFGLLRQVTKATEICFTFILVFSYKSFANPWVRLA